MKNLINSILLLYHYPAKANAKTIKDHISAFGQYSAHVVYQVNTYKGFPEILKNLEFSVVLLHYTLFGSYPFKLSNKFFEHLKNSENCIKVAFFQDEYTLCKERFAIIDSLGIDVVYTLLGSEYFQKVYYDNTSVKEVRNTLPGYISDDLLDYSINHNINFKKRKIDVGYRGRKLPFFLGKGAQEKYQIAKKFQYFAKNKNFTLDISTTERDRIYGENWYKFITNCKFMLGVQSGSSVFDINDNLRDKVDKFVKDYPESNFQEVEDKFLRPFEDIIDYRQVSPRIFECAVLKTCMILFADNYQSILIPDKHYIPLQKDFSNIDEVFKKMKDGAYVRTLINNSFQDIALSNHYHYANLASDLDQCLKNFISLPKIKIKDPKIKKLLEKLSLFDKIKFGIISFKDATYGMPGREYLKKIVINFGYKRE